MLHFSYIFPLYWYLEGGAFNVEDRGGNRGKKRDLWSLFKESHKGSCCTGGAVVFHMLKEAISQKHTGVSMKRSKR